MVSFKTSIPAVLLLVAGAMATPRAITPSSEVIAGHFKVNLPKTPLSEAVSPAEGAVLSVAGAVSKRSDIEKRTPGCVYLTSDSNFGGQTAYLCVTNNDCTILVDAWRYGLSSFGPDWGTTCVIHTGRNCDGTSSTPFTEPGFGNLGVFNDNTGSFRCWW